MAAPRSRERILCLFDVDGTLTPPRQVQPFPSGPGLGGCNRRRALACRNEWSPPGGFPVLPSASLGSWTQLGNSTDGAAAARFRAQLARPGTARLPLGPSRLWSRRRGVQGAAGVRPEPRGRGRSGRDGGRAGGVGGRRLLCLAIAPEGACRICPRSVLFRICSPKVARDKPETIRRTLPPPRHLRRQEVPSAFQSFR